MVDKIGDKKLGKIDPNQSSRKVDESAGVDSVKGIRKTSSVAPTSKVGSLGKRRPTREMTLEERELLFKLISEEADKLFAGSSEKRKNIATGAVKMAIDAGLLNKEQAGTPPSRKTPKKEEN